MALHAPHQTVEVHNEQERFLVKLLDSLWERYRSRMEYVRQYEDLIQSHQASFFNDHIAFRTIALQKPLAGIFRISRIFEALGYQAANAYEFPDKHLSSIHYQHLNPRLPKLFITQLKTWELSLKSQRIIQKTLKSHELPLEEGVLDALYKLESMAQKKREILLKKIIRYFRELPWDLPQKKDVLELDQETQYGAWVLIHGYDVNHFTALVGSHGVPALEDIEKVVHEMRRVGIPMKKEIEGEPGSKLRQSSTESVMVEGWVKEGKKKVKMPWSYAYFEIAERPLFKNPITGAMERFEGFLGSQATHLFDMTKVRSL
jgi:hypothetical protein